MSENIVNVTNHTPAVFINRYTKTVRTRGLGLFGVLLLFCLTPNLLIAEKINEKVTIRPSKSDGFQVLGGISGVVLIFDGQDGKFSSGAIDVLKNGRLFLGGSAKFTKINNADFRGAIDVREGGTLHIELQDAGDEIWFEDILADYDIKNEGILLIRAREHTRLMLSKGIHSGEVNGKLEIVGPGEVDIGTSVISEGSIKFTDYPIITLHISQFDENISEIYPSHRGGGGAAILASSRNGDRTIFGNLYINPKIPDGHYTAGTIEEYMYIAASNGAGEGNRYVPRLPPYVSGGFGYSVAFRSGGEEDSTDAEDEDKYVADEYEPYRRDTLEFTFEKDTDVVSGLQKSKLIVEDGAVLTTKGGREPIFFMGLDAGAIEIKGSGEAYIVGSALFRHVRSDNLGVIDLLGGAGKLSILMPMFGDSIEFERTGGNTMDIYSARTSVPVRIDGAEGTLIRLSNGIKGGSNGHLIMAGPFSMDVGRASIEQHNITVEGHPEIVFSPIEGGKISINAKGSIAGAPIVKAKLTSRQAADLLAGRDHFSYEYLKAAEDVDLDGYNPIIGMSNITGQMGNFETAIDPDFAKNPRESKRRFAIFPKNRVITGTYDSRIVVYGGQRVTNYGSTIFSNIVRGESSESVLYVAADGVFEVELRDPSDVVLFRSNRGASGPNDIDNFGTVLINGSGAVRFIAGGIAGPNGTLVTDGPSVLDIHDARVDQKTVRFGNRTTLVLDIGGSITSRDFGEDGKSGGTIKIQENGSLEGSPAIDPTLADETVSTLNAMTSGEVLDFKYVIPGSGVAMDNFVPRLSRRFKFVESGGSLARDAGASATTSPTTTQIGVELAFGGTEEEPDYTTLRMRKREIRDISQDVVFQVMGNNSRSRQEAISTFFGSMLARDKRAQEAIELENGGEIVNVFAQRNPDSNMVSVDAMSVPLQSSASIMVDRMSSLLESPSPDMGPALTAANDDRLAYGALKDKMSGAHAGLLNRLWFQYIRSFGSQKLDESTKTSGNGFLVGIDHRLSRGLKLGLAYTLTKDRSESDNREKNVTTHVLSIYGEYRHRSLYVGTVASYGWNDTRDNRLSGKGNVFYMAPVLGYRLVLRKEGGSKFTLTPELGVRYFHTHQGEQKDDMGSVIATVNRNTLVPVLGVRLAGLFDEKIDLMTRLNFSYDAYSSGDKSRSVTMYDGQSYQLVDESGDRAKFATEAGITLGYRLTDSLRTSIGYSGRYSSNLNNNSITLEASLRF
ncbi:MAG: autotransporter outer membrane beta-barrel domain-containing protein [Rickettsiales bacterium]|jgi:outer membrane autotransporter protein|nr:autotransporter outer membrane beta-barrel domain-containing protein [Rickettsiales bacterium]